MLRKCPDQQDRDMLIRRGMALLGALSVLAATTVALGTHVAHATQAATFDLVTPVADGSGPASGQYGFNPMTMSTDARYVAYRSDATTLVPNDTNGQPDIFVRDRTAGA